MLSMLTDMQFSQVTSNLIESIVSIKRLAEFLGADQLQEDARIVVRKPRLELGDEV